MKEITSTDLSTFSLYERKKARDLLNAWIEKGLPDGFYRTGTTIMKNDKSGCVFLTNEDFQAAMINNGKLEIWHYCHNCGHEGFDEDCRLNDHGCNECWGDDE